MIGLGGIAVAGLPLTSSMLVVAGLGAVAGLVTGYGNLMLIT